MPKKLKQIKAEKYEENIEIEDEIVEDDYYEDEYETAEEVIEESPNNFKATEEISEKANDEDEYEDAKSTFRREKYNKFMNIFNVVYIIIIIILFLIGIDVVCVATYNVGPFFAIKTKTYNDGGTKEYYGLGYKIIKYSETNGRQDTKIGFWSMKYSTEPIKLQDVDLAIFFQNDPEKTANNYYKEYVLIESTIKEIDYENNELILAYIDPDGKYTLEIECDMASSKEKLSGYKVNDKVSIKGTVHSFTVQDEENNNKVLLLNCYIA